MRVSDDTAAAEEGGSLIADWLIICLLVLTPLSCVACTVWVCQWTDAVISMYTYGVVCSGRVPELLYCTVLYCTVNCTYLTSPSFSP
jgi:hypothetical protein